MFVTSHQAHFIRTVETMPEYVPVALSKRAGEDALRERIPELEAAGIEFVVVSGDMIEGTITATLLERANPGAIGAARTPPASSTTSASSPPRSPSPPSSPFRPTTPATSATCPTSKPATNFPLWGKRNHP